MLYNSKIVQRSSNCIMNTCFKLCFSIKKAQEELSSSEDESDLLTVKVKTAAEKV